MLYAFDHGFWVGGFLITVKRPYVHLSSLDRQKGERVGGFQEWVDGGMGVSLRNGWMGG
jgi:hypothetical protein